MCVISSLYSKEECFQKQQAKQKWQVCKNEQQQWQQHVEKRVLLCSNVVGSCVAKIARPLYEASRRRRRRGSPHHILFYLPFRYDLVV